MLVLESPPRGQPIRCHHCRHAFAAREELPEAAAGSRPRSYAADLDDVPRDESRIPPGTLAGLAAGALACVAGVVLIVVAVTWHVASGRDTGRAAIRPEPMPVPTVVLEPPKWNVHPRPVPVPDSPTEWSNDSLTFPGDEQLIFPNGPHPFVLSVGTATTPPRVWNLASMKQVGSLPIGVKLSDPVALSPDGKWVASQVKNEDRFAVGIWSTADETQAHTLVGPKGSEFSHLFFTDAGHVLALHTQESASKVCLWTLETEKLEPPFAAVMPSVPTALAVSAGGQFIATGGEDGRIRIYDVSLGQEVGTIDPPKQQFDGGPRSCKGLVFASDLNELAALLSETRVTNVGVSQGETSVGVWQLGTGSPAPEIRCPAQLLNDVGLTNAVAGPPLETSPNGVGWLVYGGVFVSRKNGGTGSVLPPAGNRLRYARAHFVAPGRLALLHGEAEAPGKSASTCTLRTIPLPDLPRPE